MTMYYIVNKGKIILKPGLFMKNLIITAILIALASLAYADYHYASHEGSNEYPYSSWETATDSIQLAVEAANPYDTIFIGTGEYSQLIRVPEENHHLGIIGMGIDSTYIWTDAPAGTHLMFVADSNFISDIHFEHRGLNNCIVPRPTIPQDIDFMVSDCLFTGTGNAGGGIMNLGSGSLCVENCIFNSLDDGISNIASGNPAFVIIRNCLAIGVGNVFDIIGLKVIFENNIGINTGPFFYRFGRIDTLIMTNNISYNASFSYLTHFGPDSNVICNNISAAARVEAFSLIGNYSGGMYNNSLTGGRRGISFIYPNHDNLYDLRYNNLKNRESDIDNAIPETIDTSIVYHAFPMFVDPENRDFHLQEYSKLIDAGHPDILDVDGTRSDIGAYGGPGGTSYHYQDLPPLIPDSITFDVAYDSIPFNWHMNEETDFNRYFIFRDTASGFEPSVFNLIAEPETSYFVDTDFIHQQPNYYRLASVDNQDNQSDYSPEIEVIPTGIYDFGGANLPRITAITNNYPNPFNSTTTIVYHVANLGPVPARTDIEIYDILGRKVRTLVSKRQDIGTHKITWDSRDDDGYDLSSGVYFAKINQWGVSLINKPKKIVLIR